MHEFGLAKGILEITLAEAARHGAKKVTAVEVVVGELNNIVAGSLRFALRALSAETIARGMKVRLKREKIRITCRECGREGRPRADLVFKCRGCGGGNVDIIAGKTLLVTGLDIDS